MVPWDERTLKVTNETDWRVVVGGAVPQLLRHRIVVTVAT